MVMHTKEALSDFIFGLHSFMSYITYSLPCFFCKVLHIVTVTSENRGLLSIRYYFWYYINHDYLCYVILWGETYALIVNSKASKVAACTPASWHMCS